jgi:hypothetical protein
MSNNIVLELAKKGIGDDVVLNDLITRARRYVLSHMTSEVGVRKMAKEKWGMVLAPRVEKACTRKTKNRKRKTVSHETALPGLRG